VEDALKLKIASLESSLAAAIRAINFHHPGSLEEYTPPLTIGIPTTVNKPDFSAESGTINQTTEDNDEVITVVGLNDSTYLNIGVHKDFYIQMDVRAVDDFADILFFRTASGGGFTFKLDTRNGQFTGFNGINSSFTATDGAHLVGDATHDTNEWYTIRLEVMNNKTRAFIDGQFYAELEHVQTIADVYYSGTLSLANNDQVNYTYMGLGHGDFKNIAYGGLQNVPETTVPSGGDDVSFAMAWDSRSGYTENTLNTTTGVFAYTDPVGASSDYIAIEYTTTYSGNLGDKVLRVAFGDNNGAYNKPGTITNKAAGVLRFQSSSKVFWGSTNISPVPVILLNDGQEHTYAIVLFKQTRQAKFFIDGTVNEVLELTDASFDPLFTNFEHYYASISMDPGGLTDITVRANTDNFVHTYGMTAAPTSPMTSVDLSTWTFGGNASYDAPNEITTVESGGHSYFDLGLTDNYAIEAEVDIHHLVADIMFARNDAGDGQYFRISADANYDTAFNDPMATGWTTWVPNTNTVAHSAEPKQFPDGFHKLKLVVQGGTVTAFINDVEYTSKPFTAQAGFTRFGIANQGRIRNVKYQDLS
jgi:hypothetical protein